MNKKTQHQATKTKQNATNTTPKNNTHHLTKTPGHTPKPNQRTERRNVLAKKLTGISRLFWVRVYARSVLVWARVWGACARLSCLDCL